MSEQFPAAFARDLSNALKDLHRGLIHSELGDDPALQNSPYSMLFALIGDPRFSWMGALSRLVTRIDEMMSDAENHDMAALATMADEAASLIGEGAGDASTFRMHHVMALQKDASVGLATGRVRKVLADRPAALKTA